MSKDKGRCQFNCRTQKQAFMAGHFAGLDKDDYSELEWAIMKHEAKEFYKQWKREKKEGAV